MAEAGILAEIVTRKRADVAARLSGVSIHALRSKAEPSRRSLKAALARPGARFIFEIKRASPSLGALRLMPPPRMRSAYSPTRPISADRSMIWLRFAESMTGRSSPRISSSIRARS
jgi:hypothetical protein